MIRTLTFFTNNGFQEVTLPAINNEDYLLVMESKKRPELRGIKLRFEVIRDIWYLLEVAGAEMENSASKTLFSGDIINIVKDGEEIAIKVVILYWIIKIWCPPVTLFYSFMTAVGILKMPVPTEHL